MHSIVEFVSGLHIDICGLMVSLFACVDFGPRPLPRHQRWVVTVPPVAVPAGGSRREQWDMDGLVPYMEEVASRVSDDGWWHLSTNIIASIHNLPLELTGVMRKMAMACEHFRRAVRGDLPTEDESSLKDDVIESEIESKSD